MSTPTKIDWAENHYSAIGQSLYYALVTGKKPAVVLLRRGDDDRYIYRCQAVCAKYGIRLHVEP